MIGKSSPIKPERCDLDLNNRLCTNFESMEIIWAILCN